jgi:redox-sensitive bicupin YhaK (pirin superfamily)
LSSPVQNHTRIIIADIKLAPEKSIREVIPGHFTTFIYVLQGSVKTGDDNSVVGQDQAGWFNRSDDPASTLQLQAGNEGARFVLYSAEPQRHQIVSYGPFIADSMDEIKNLYADYRQGKIQHIDDVSESQKVFL